MSKLTHDTERRSLTRVLVKSGVVKGFAEARRLFRQGAIRVNDKAITDDTEVAPGDIIRVGRCHTFQVQAT